METTVVAESGLILALIGALIGAILGGVGSSIGILGAGTTSAGVLSEKPNLFGKLLILTALPGSQGVYGLLIALMILMKVGTFAGGADVSMEAGKQLLVAGILTGVACLCSGWLQGKVVVAGIGAVARNEKLSANMIVLSALIETYAIFGLLIGLLIANGVIL